MSKRQHKISDGLSIQPELFDSGMEEGALDIDLGHRQCLSRAMHNSGKDRYQIAAEMSRLMAATVSKEMLDKYAASDPHNGLRAVMLTPFCYVTGTFEPISYLLHPLGSDILNPQDRDLIELARLMEQQKVIETQIMTLRAKRNLK